MSGRARSAVPPLLLPAFLPLLTALLTALLAALLAGCGAGGGGEDSGADRSIPAVTPSGPGAAAPEDGTNGDAGSEAAGNLPEETLPEEELTPAEGEFTEEQREYLAGRVPRGVDPNAILALGTEACERVGYLARHDPEGAVAALREEEIPGADEAVSHLCPEYTELLEEAGRTDQAGNEGAQE